MHTHTHTYHSVLYWTIDADSRDVCEGGTTKFGDRGTNFLLRCFRCLIVCIVGVFVVVVTVTLALLLLLLHTHISVIISVVVFVVIACPC